MATRAQGHVRGRDTPCLSWGQLRPSWWGLICLLSGRRPTGTKEEGTWGQGQAWEVRVQETRDFSALQEGVLGLSGQGGGQFQVRPHSLHRRAPTLCATHFWAA